MKRHNNLPQILLVLAGCTASASAQSTILWNEAVNGPISANQYAPTQFGSLAIGTNSVLGASELEPTGPGYLVHEDYFTFQVPSGFAVNAMILSVDRPYFGTWIGGPSFSSTLAYLPSTSNGDVLVQAGLSPLLAGSYSMYVANHDAQPYLSVANYRFDFVVQNIPEPGVGSLLVSGLGALLLRRSVARRR